VPTQVGIRELLESGVHFGHQTRRWNPKMRRFIFGERSGIYLIDLLKTEALLAQAQQFADGVARRGGTVLFVGTKKQARDGIKEIAEAAGQPYVNHRWLGGLLTNFQTISNRIKRLHDLERYESEGQLQLLPTRERLSAQADLEKLRANLGGVKNMQRVPDAMFVIDLKTEAIAVREAQRLRIPIIGLVDTNCDPDGIDYVIPGNDDAMRACNVITRAIGDTIAEGRARFRAEEEEARRQAEEQARREAEEKARREAEEEARKQAEAEAAAQALTQTEAETREAAEAQVAEAVEANAGRQVEGRRDAEVAAAAQAADEPAAPAAGSPGPPEREKQNPNAGERTPQAAGAPQGEGAPASDTTATEPAAPAASEARQEAAAAKAEPKPAAPEPGPSPIAEAAEEAAPADVDAVAPEEKPAEPAGDVTADE
jgi:small subunit ribosomal protein S2